MRRFYFVTALAALCVLMCACAATPAPNGAADPSAGLLSIGASGADSPGAATAVSAARGAVVGISTMGVDDNNAFVQGVGTGFIVDKSGLALTNAHVISGAARVTAVFDDGTRRPAAVLWRHEALDLAVLKIEGDDFAVLDIFSAPAPQSGDQCLVIGTPLSMQFQHTVTGGIISSVGRTLAIAQQGGYTFYQDLIQTDASVNPGNSGGPMLNSQGQVTGIVTLKITEAEGIGFAVPIDIARTLIRRFVSEGNFVTPYIGVYAIDPQLARYYEPSAAAGQGLHVLSVDSFGPAARAGIKTGDVIERMDGIATTTMLDLRRQLFEKNIGDTVTLDCRSASGEQYYALVTISQAVN